jgi:hypothetical protein
LTSFTGNCTILTLHTGAIALSVLGLNVSLAPIDPVITATAAPGNLLGNLRWAVAHLLDANNPSLGAITQLAEPDSRCDPPLTWYFSIRDPGDRL